MQRPIYITIPTPCHEKWKEMTPTQKGMHCKACNKVLTDFSIMTDSEIADFFLTRKEEKICGHFRNAQLNRPVYFISPDVLLMDIPAWKKYIAILFICFSGLITGCENKQAEYIYPIPETIQHTNIQIVAKDSLTNTHSSCESGTTDGFTQVVLGNINVEYEKLPRQTELEKILSITKK
jgi:hypothetical protein